ncbi:MAG: PAS domain S-box protein [Actinobacteria bacterium]|nr:PAS domain S-box protein [Actinomycetota bacterium]MBU1943290.1 PAS domain S-box protein [Actinomycetota bacterium]MBU2686592.1 PAS domain S-box protein [Actinomycetota bacterium]
MVDDDPGFTSLLKTVLKSRFSAEVTVAGDCATARRALDGSWFDLVTMDYELPDGNGIDLMEEILSVEGSPPVVVVTGRGDEKIASRACLVGAAGYVTKDQKLNTMLVSAVRNALESTHSAKLQYDSEIRYRRLFETARDGILILDADTGEIEDANPYLVEILGYSLDEFIGRQLWEIGPFMDAGLSNAAFEELKEKRYIRYENLPLETKDGRKVDVEFVSNIYVSDHREVIQCNIRDITVRKGKEAALRESEAWYRALYDSSLDGIVSTDMDGNITGANKAYLDMLGYSLDEVTDLTYQQLTPEKWHVMEQDLVDTQITVRGFSDIYEKEYVRKDGSVFPISIRTWLIEDERGEPTGMWATVRDITEQKKAEEELQRVNLELEGFAHTVSHDLRGPLSAIGSATSLIQEALSKTSTLDEAQAELVSIISNSVERSSNLIESLLALAEAGQCPQDPSTVDIKEVVESVILENAARIEEAGVSVEVTGDLGSVRASATHMYQLFANLIGNAVSHCDSENPKITVSRLEDEEREGYRYLVRDNGSGIPPEDLDRVFMPFFRGKSGDTGVGLAIVKKIVGIYNGEITAYNDDGACFDFVMRNC